MGPVITEADRASFRRSSAPGTGSAAPGCAAARPDFRRRNGRSGRKDSESSPVRLENQRCGAAGTMRPARSPRQRGAAGQPRTQVSRGGRG